MTKTYKLYEVIKRRRRPKMGLREPSQIRCPAHLQFVRGHECCVKGFFGHVCKGKIEAHHVRLGTDGGIGLKPSDRWAVPLCVTAHKILHDGGQITFENRWNIDLKEIAEGLAGRSPALRKQARTLAR